MSTMQPYFPIMLVLDVPGKFKIYYDLFFFCMSYEQDLINNRPFICNLIIDVVT